MTKTASLVSLVILFVLGSMAPATAQGRREYRSYDSDCLVWTTGGNCFMPAAGGIYDQNYSRGRYDRQYDYGRYRQYRRHFDDYGDLDWNPYGYYGRYDDRYSRFEPILDSCGRQYKPKGARAWEGAAKIGATTVLGAILGGKRGAVAGGVAGGAWVAYDQSRYYSNPNEACQALGGQQANYEWPTAEGQVSPNIGQAGPREPGWTLVNKTKRNARVTYGKNEEVLSPGQFLSLAADDIGNGIKAEIIRIENGHRGTEEAVIKEKGTTLEIREQ